MKSLIAMLALLTLTSTAMANPHRHHGPHGHNLHHGHHVHHHGWRHPVRIIHHHHRDWVAPLIIGGVVGAAIAHNRAEAQTLPAPQPAVPPLIVPPVAVVPNANCVIVRETLHPDGVIVRDLQCRERQ